MLCTHRFHPEDRYSHRAQAGNFQEQLHRVDCEQEEAVSGGSCCGPPTPGLSPFQDLLRSGCLPYDTHIPPAPPVWALSRARPRWANQGCLLTRPACAPAAWGAARHCLSIRRIFPEHNFHARHCTGWLEFRGRQGMSMLHWGGVTFETIRGQLGCDLGLLERRKEGGESLEHEREEVKGSCGRGTSGHTRGTAGNGPPRALNRVCS